MRWLWLLLLAAPVYAAPADDAKKQLETVRDDLQKLRAQLPAAVDALHTLENRVEALSRELQGLSEGRSAEPFVQRAIDELRVEVSALERRLASTQLRLSDAPEPAVRFGYDDGLYLKTQPVRLFLNVALMPRWVGAFRDGQANSSDFELHHGQLQIRGEILGWIDVQLMLDFGAEFLGDGRADILRDAFIDVHATSWLTLRAGQFKVPFSRQRLVYSPRQTFIDRSLATRAFSFDRDLGGMIEFALLQQKLLIQVAVTDGVRAGPAVHNDNLDFAYTLRLLGQPFGPVPLTEGDVTRTRPLRLSVGVAFQFDLQPNDPKADLDRDGAPDNLAVYTLGGEAALKWRGLAVEGEYFFRLEQPGAGLPRQIYQGAYLQVSGMVWRGLQLGARGAYAQPHRLGGMKLGLFGEQPRAGWEVGGVGNYWVWRQMVRAQVSYDYRRDTQNGVVQQGHIVQVQLHAGF